MPALPPIANVLRIRTVGTVQGTAWNTVQHARYSGTPPDAAALATLCTGVGTAWLNALGPLCNPVVSLVSVDIADLTSETGAFASADTPHPGTRTGTVLPNQVAMVASYKIARRYRGGHPRSYWPAGNNADIINGKNWSSAFLSVASTGASAWVGNINALTLGGQPLQHGCVSYYIRDPNNPGHSMLRPTPLFFTTLSVAVHSRLDTMRRRLGKEAV